MANDGKNKMASFRGRCQTEGPIESEQCKAIYFIEDRGNAFHLRRFKSKESAAQLLKVLKRNWHYTFPRLSPIFEVEGQDDYFLAFEKLGTSLEDFVNEHKKLFCNNRHLISSLYQNILIDLIRLCQHLKTVEVKPLLSLTNIFVLRNSNDNDSLHLTVVDFDFRDGPNMDCVLLATLVEQINDACDYEPCGSLEMHTFVGCLNTAYENFFAELYNQPVLWTLDERRSFTCDLCECLNTFPLPIYHEVQIFTKDPLRWEDEFRRHNKLSKLKKGIEAAETAYKMKMGTRQKGSGKGKHNCSEMVQKENATRDCLGLIRKSYAHIDEVKQRLQDPDLDCEEQLQILFEYTFPLHIGELRKQAITMESTLHKVLLPRPTRLIQ
ncbi:unnamed protein product [Camellia sinensis]